MKLWNVTEVTMEMLFGEITIFNDNCSVRYVYKFNGEKFLKEEVSK